MPKTRTSSTTTAGVFLPKDGDKNGTNQNYDKTRLTENFSCTEKEKEIQIRLPTTSDLVRSTLVISKVSATENLFKILSTPAQLRDDPHPFRHQGSKLGLNLWWRTPR